MSPRPLLAQPNRTRRYNLQRSLVLAKTDTVSGQMASLLFLAVLVLCLPSLALPQASGTIADLKKLQYFIGAWTLAGDMKTSPFGAGGKFTGTQQNDWATDGMSVISKWSDSLPTGIDSGKGIYSYDLIRRIYKCHGTSSDGEVEDSTGTVDGETWTWLSNPKGPNGTAMRGRYIQKITSPMSYDFRFEIASEGGGWMTVREGKAEKSH
jgi:hypothetical protein